MIDGSTRRRAILVGAVPYLWVLLFLVLPLLFVLRLSLSQSVLAQPPYAPVFGLADGLEANIEKLGQFGLDAYRGLVSDSLYIDAYISSVVIAAIATALTLLVAFPFAYAIAASDRRWRPTLLALVMAPFWTSFLIRVYALSTLIRNDGPLEQLLVALRLITPPLDLFASNSAVVLGIVYSYLPFMVLPIYTALERRDPALLEAARDLGAGPLTAFVTITLPLALPGVLAGSLLVFIPAVGEFVIPDLLGGSDTLMIGRVMWNDFFANRDWPTAAAAAITLVLLLLVPLLLAERRTQRDTARA